jgi:hypothetical protein
MTLDEFLLARIAEDEEAMGRIAGRQWFACDDGHVQEPEFDDRDWDDPNAEARLPNHHNSWALVLDPARVLAECEAKRQIVQGYRDTSEMVEQLARAGRDEEAQAVRYGRLGIESALSALALPYGDHPDYHEEWRS